jgi:hypothetical protein
MPVRYIRYKKLHEQYKGLDGTPPPPPSPAVVAQPAKDIVTPFQPGYTPIKRIKGKKRDYMTDGVLQGFGTPP